MFQRSLSLLFPLLRPSSATRCLALLTLVLLATSMLVLGAQPGIEEAIPNPPWDKLTHMLVFGGYGALAGIVVQGASHIQPVTVAGLIALVDEGLQYHSPARTADFQDIFADLAGALVAVFILRRLQAAVGRERLPAAK